MMQPERWQEIAGICESALALAPAERAAYLEAQCGLDQSLRREVERLIESHGKAAAENFIDSPAAEMAAPLLAADASVSEESKNALAAGEQLGHYVVIEKLGAGGMGEVYLARDTRLDRTVALKILPADIASDKRRMRRFRQEAKIASSLNQPNILTIFEFGEADSLNFIATEYIDGETLRRYAREKPLKLTETIEVSIQVAAALDAAHEAKIAHRDIKPENIMIRRRDQIVKVLDFGLAKLSEPSTGTGGASDSEAATAVLVQTMPGSVMGTVSYMSPEQAQGLAVDGRTDLWSTGVLIYELVAGRLPFSGLTMSHTIVEIIEKEPAPLANFVPAVPAELQRIVGKALAKNANERYQTAKDMLIDLRSLKKRLEVDAEIERSASPEGTSAVTDESTVKRSRAGEASTSAREIERALSRRQKRVLGFFLVAMAAATTLIIGISVWRSSHPAITTPASLPVAAPTNLRKLNYWIMVQKYRDKRPYQEPFRLAGEINFERDYKVRLYVTSPQTGYLYILNEPPTGDERLSILFPSPTANGGSPALAENKPIPIPEVEWFNFDQEQGPEKVWLVWSKTAITELEPLKQFANTRDRGIINNPNLNRAARNFLQAHSIPQPEVERLDDRKETTVSSKGDLIVHSIRLEHH